MMGLAFCVMWCNVSILNKSGQGGGGCCVPVCGHGFNKKSWANIIASDKCLSCSLISPFFQAHTPHNLHFAPVLIIQSGGKARLLAYWTELVQKGLMSTRARVREDAGLSSGGSRRKGPLLLAVGSNGLCMKWYLHLEVSLKKGCGVSDSRNLID